MSGSFWDLPGVMPKTRKGRKGPTRNQVMALRGRRVYATKSEALDVRDSLEDQDGREHAVYPESHYGIRFWAVR